MFASTNFPDSVVLERNPTSWDPAQGNVEELEFVGIRDTSARLNALLSGEADINLYVDLRDVPRLESAGGYRTEVVSSTRQFTLHLPMNLDVMQDLNVRRALNHAVDRDQIVETVYSGAAFPAVTVFGPGQGGHEDLGQLEYDPDLSLDLWAEAGWVPGSAGVLENSETGEPFPTVVLTASDGRYPQDAAHAEAVGGYLTEIGVPIELRIEGDFGTYFDSIINEAAEQNWIAQMPWGSYDGDGAESLCPMYLSDQENNLGGYENPALGQICDDISSSFDLEQRDALIAQGAALVYADLPAIYTLSPSYIVGLRDDTEDLVIVSFELHDFSDARVAG